MSDQLISMATTPPVSDPWDAYSLEPARQACEGPLVAKRILATFSSIINNVFLYFLENTSLYYLYHTTVLPGCKIT